MITWNDFENVDIRTGTILEVHDFPKAKKPAWKLIIDFGELGIKKSSAQIKTNYSAKDLIGKQILAVVNFPPKQIADFMSECLVLGIEDDADDIVLLQTERLVPNGRKVK
ncbi:MAG: tRNA-binding protein [Bacteroidetes bacterium]|nr:MAG: tRNA-binding protein [Bacteroidota bacterium]MBL1144173.1 tRNA-binding protein [Bacteroidota bacterium]MCB0803553.1 tRNA-binding protein [Flavobacteriales bacterium]NOG56969.1 tRNA-binding protein [Bacteroidota bacterium]